MTSPAPPPAGPAPSPPAPSPNGGPAPVPAPAPPAPAQHGPAPTADDVARLQSALEQERLARKDAEAKLDTATTAAMSEHEKAVATARAEGKAEAEAAAARTLAAAEFRVLAAGRIANPEAAIAALDLAKLIGKNGQPDRTAIAALVEQLAAAPAQGAPPAGGHFIPAGPRQPAQAGGDTDWLRQIQRPGGRRTT